ncbi:Coq4 family protein [Hyalangium gracile]|uniref:Coq4 family protein n=1 Tax=Hyalangium gracile TaxID=394092 RepID=UPI001CCB682C|nr:Coq4 family protein [Hyalangium gracile]
MFNLPLSVRGGHAFLRLTRAPNRLDEVFRLIDSIHENPRLSQQLVEAYRQTPRGVEALRSQPRLGAIDLEALGRLPEGTLGHEYSRFMRRHGLDPAALPIGPVKDEVSFIEAHMRETHDLWHVVTGFGPDVAGELGLQAFYLAQFPNRVALSILSAGLLNTLLYAFEDSGARMTQISRGWLLGRQARPLFGMDWKQLWNTPLSEVRAQLGLGAKAVEEVAPTLLQQNGRETVARA